MRAGEVLPCGDTDPAMSRRCGARRRSALERGAAAGPGARRNRPGGEPVTTAADPAITTPGSRRGRRRNPAAPRLPGPARRHGRHPRTGGTGPDGGRAAGRGPLWMSRWCLGDAGWRDRPHRAIGGRRRGVHIQRWLNEGLRRSGAPAWPGPAPPPGTPAGGADPNSIIIS